ncbi:hypothetical protein [Hymenobacter weizhouensis]|uniref:hypothetical protein n=1 Tax=Hymenobacter sp. YIM 151500-1 TaxID=2987689 RepID=UPI002226A2DD|nr:hypothetical protein [Hymenobacter sp. YIM 151500-1]UYZ62535.1 hypothetical protein OIS53_16235 [Hymenobacter sp. YIM 151500-1]
MISIIFKYKFYFSGEAFNPDKIEIQSNDVEIAKHPETESAYAYISIGPKKRYGLQYSLLEYDDWFVDFIEKNYELLTKHGVNDIQLSIEVYYRDDQCNFEILSNSLLKRISKFNISIPVSVYKLDGEYFDNWLKEIDV